MNPFEQKPKKSLMDMVPNWKQLAVKPYDKLEADPYTKARIILMEAEQDICEMMDDMGDTYAKNDAALRLRAMHLLYESVRETGGTVVVPSSFSEGFGDVLGDAAKDALGGKAEA